MRYFYLSSIAALTAGLLIFSSLALPPTARAAHGDMVLVSCNSSGEPANSYCFDPSMSQDGRYIAFESYATNMFAGDSNNNSDILRKDLQTEEVLLCSCDASGNQAGLGSLRPSISSDGRYVAFDTNDDDLWPGDVNSNHDVFRKDLQTGELELVSSGPYGIGGGDSTGPSTSSDGRYVAFESTSYFYLPGGYYSGKNVYRKDFISGELKICSCGSSGTPAGGPSYDAHISADGRYVAFQSEGTDLVPGILDSKQIYRKDLQTGEIILCSCNVMGDEGNYGGSYTSISPDGRFLSFRSASTNLIPDKVERSQFFRKDLETGEVGLCSCDSSGNQRESGLP